MASQLDVYKLILVSIVNKGKAVARLVVRLLILDDLGTVGIRQETCKYIENLLASIAKAQDSSLQRACGTFGGAINDICNMPGRKLDAAISKVLIDHTARVLRSLDICRVDMSDFLSQLLGTPSLDSQILF